MQSSSSAANNSGGSSRRLERVKKHVNKHWIPINEELGAKILEGIDEGIYDLDIDFLIADLRNDIGLLLLCLRELAVKAAASNLPRPVSDNPFDVIRRAGLNQVGEVLTKSIMNGSRHSYSTSSDVQTDRITEMLVAASAVEVMTENMELSTEQGYSVSLLRQLGMALIAWNYPGLYERAMSSIHEGEDPDEIITAELGTSPVLLSIKVIDDWGLPGEVTQMIAPDKSEDIGVDMLKSLCEAGEALARANDPKRYPEARNEWEHAREFVQDLIGDDAMHLIRRKIKENSEHLFTMLPDRFQRLNDFNPDAVIYEEEEQKKLFRNPYVKDCPFILRAKFKELYSRMKNGEIDRKNVAFLINQIIPAAGFTGGIIYIINPASMKLMPQMTFGDLNLTAAKPIRVGDDVMFNHPVQLAFNGWDTVEGNKVTSEIRSHTYMSNTIGSQKKAGVLYLEMNCAKDLSLGPTDYKQQFNAILHALNEVLNLS